MLHWLFGRRAQDKQQQIDPFLTLEDNYKATANKEEKLNMNRVLHFRNGRK
jgi:hypothetical protein